MKTNAITQSPLIKGWWKFEELGNEKIVDSSGNNNFLIATGKPKKINQNGFGGFAFDGETQWLSTVRPVLRTDQSFSIMAWVRLDRLAMGRKILLKPGINALTAVSQDSPTHSAFHLGIRRMKKPLPGQNPESTLKWCFTVSPIDGSDTSPLECQDAYSENLLDDSMLDKWILLVGVCNVTERSARLYVPSLNDAGVVHVPDVWSYWQANEGLQIGRSQWLGQDVDHWPGSVGPVKVFSGVLNSNDIKKIYEEDIAYVRSNETST